MIVISVTLQVPPEDWEKFRAASAIFIASSRAEPGVIAYTFAEDFGERGVFRIFEMYASRDALNAHLESAHFKAWRPLTAAYPRTQRWLFEVDAPTSNA